MSAIKETTEWYLFLFGDGLNTAVVTYGPSRSNVSVSPQNTNGGLNGAVASGYRFRDQRESTSVQVRSGAAAI